MNWGACPLVRGRNGVETALGWRLDGEVAGFGVVGD